MSEDWFGGRLRELRLSAKLSQQELAERAGMKIGGIADIEQGRNSPMWGTVLALADALGVDVNEFRKEPAEQPAPKRGRPKKVKDEPTTHEPPESDLG